MNVVFFTDTYEPQINGVVTSIKNFSSGLKEANHNVYIACPGSPKHEFGRNVYKYPSLGFWGYSGYRIAIPKRLKMKDKIDIVHVHTPATMGLVGMLYSKYHKRPCIGTFHTVIPEYVSCIMKGLERKAKIREITKRILWKYVIWFYNKCDAVIVPSPSIKKMLRRHGLKRDIYVIPTGMETDKRRGNRKELRKKYGFGPEDKIILHVGRLSKEKNIFFILDSIKKIKYDKLIITSDGPVKKALERHAKKNKIPNVIFTGFVPKRHLQDLYSISDVLVFASRSETQALILLEAVFNNLPVVVLSSPVLRDFVIENKIGITSSNRNFGHAVEKVLGNDTLRERFKMNCKPARKKYSIESTTAPLIRLYSKLSHH